MAVATIGKIEEFDGTKENWQQYVERLGFFFAANGIDTAEKKRSVFLFVIGPSTYKILRNLVAPTHPGEKEYDVLVDLLSKHFKPTPSEIVERCKFHSRFRRPGESVATFVAELRSLSEFCNFGDTLEVMIRDRLVCGINDDAIQKRLLSEPDLTYSKSVEIAQNMEMAAQNVKELKTKSEQPNTSQSRSVPDVNKISDSPGTTKKKFAVTCYRCGKTGHTAPSCRVSRLIVCHQCGKRGHLQKACKSQPKTPGTVKTRGYKQVRRVQDEEDEEEPMYHVRLHGSIKSPPILVKLTVDDCLLKMELDTGASMSIMSAATFHELWPGRNLDSTDVRLQSYSKEPIPVVGCCYVNLRYKGQSVEKVPLIVVEGSGPSLLGRDWLTRIQLDWKQINHVQAAGLHGVLDRHSDVFQEGLGTMKGFTAKIYVDPKATPSFNPARSVPYALRDKVEQELVRLTEEGVIEPVEVSEWATPIVAVLKHDKKNVRICGDFRVTINPISKLDRYPIPKVDDLFAKLSQGKFFSKLDLSHAYQQLPLDEESKQYVVINTHKGLFRYTRLPFGISSAPAIFQRVIESLLQGIDGVVTYLDDILIAGDTEQKHLEALDEVLTRLGNAGLRVKYKKCEFMRTSVTYLGHKIDGAGLHPLQNKVQAIKDAPTPQSVPELKSYLGMLTYYGKFIPNLASALYPLYHLLKKDVPWKWGHEQQRAFQTSKDILTSDKFLAHFDPSLPLTLACDASGYGLGAVLAHKMPDGSEKPIGYASRTLTAAERNYSQLEKEGLSCIYGIKKFHDYVFGHPFELVTDHKPLLGLLKEHRATSPQASARIKRWSLFLSSYEYTLTFRNTTAHANADALSRLPLPVTPVKTELEPELVLLAEHLAESPVSAKDIRIWTAKDSKLARVRQYVQQGWPREIEPDLERYASKQLELSAYEGCVLWGNRVIVPKQGRDAVLSELHEGHPGITKMKSLARMYVWWPGINADIEKSVRLCAECQEVQSSPPVAPLHPWTWPSRPWARLHLDFAGPFQGKTFLILIDAHSKWIEAVCVPSTSSNVVIEELRTVFAKFGLPETIVTDNGSGFVSQEFETFLTENGIKHVTSAPYHPASNGLAERAVQIVKRGLKKVTAGSVNTRLSKLLLTYRMTPQSTTGISPAELLLGRRPRTRLDLLRPNTAERVEKKQMDQKARHDVRAKPRTFNEGDIVFAKNYGSGDRWLAGKVVKVAGPVSFHVKLQDGRIRRYHQDQLRHQVVDDTTTEMSDVGVDDSIPIAIPVTTGNSTTNDSIGATEPPGPQTPVEPPSSVGLSHEQSNSQPIRRYPMRERMPRERYDPGLN